MSTEYPGFQPRLELNVGETESQTSAVSVRAVSAEIISVNLNGQHSSTDFPTILSA